MAEQQVQEVEQEDQEDQTPGYKAPAEASVAKILQTDAEDDSLRKYKESLGLKPNVIVFENDPRTVIVQKLGLKAKDRDEMFLDLTGDLKKVEKQTFVIKEGCEYQINIYFYVQREIVSGLKYVQKISRGPIPVDKETIMVGSFPPQETMHACHTNWDEAPSGMMARSKYTVKSLFTDDDKKEHLKWQWQLEIKKDWSD